MKRKILYIILLIVILVLLVGCSKNKKIQNKEIINTNTIVNESVENINTAESTEEEKTEENKSTSNTNTSVNSSSKKTNTNVASSSTTKSNSNISTKKSTNNATTNTSTASNNTNTSTNQNTNTASNKKIVTTETKEEVITDNSKYGTIIQQVKQTTYNVYDDGSKEVKESTTKIKFDASNYNATTNTLLSEANSNASSYASKINEVLNYVNQYRTEVGVSPLTLDSSLTTAANVRALEIGYSNTFSHYRPNGSICFSVFNDLNIGCSFYGENIASGYSSAASVSAGWKNSQGHYENMINSSYNKIGIGVAYVTGSTYGYYWVQLFTD